MLDESGNFIDRIEETPHTSLFFLSARTSHNIAIEKINSEKSKITSRNEIENKCLLEKISILQKDEVKVEYDKISKFHSIQMKFENNIPLSSTENVELILLATVKFSELKKHTWATLCEFLSRPDSLWLSKGWTQGPGQWS